MKRALLIGINDYPLGNELHGCLEDVSNLLTALSRNGDDSKNFDIKALTNIQDSADARQNIEQLFHDDADIALFYFSGHGYIDANGGQLVFPNDLMSYAADPNAKIGIQMSEIMDIANSSHVKNKIIILDCCHAGDIGKDHIDNTSHLAHGVSILTACRENETAMELGGHGLFTELLVSALQGGAADFGGNITIGGIYAYIDRSLGAWSQRPIFKTNVSEFIPIKKVQPKVSLQVIRELTSLFDTPQMLFDLDPSYEDTNCENIEHHVIKPYADKKNVAKFKLLQKLQSIGFVEPVGEEFMYFAAMNSKQCRLTTLGQHYWRLVHEDRI